MTDPDPAPEQEQPEGPPVPGFLITLNQPMIYVLDVAPGMKILRVYDGLNVSLAVDIPIPEEHAEKIAERLTRRKSGLVKGTPADLASLRPR